MNFISIKIYSGKRVFVLAKNYFCQYGFTTSMEKNVEKPFLHHLTKTWQPCGRIKYAAKSTLMLEANITRCLLSCSEFLGMHYTED